MGMFMSLMGEGFPSTHVTSFAMGTLYKQFLERDIGSFEQFHRAILDIFETFISELPVEYYNIPSRKELEEHFNDWKRAPESQKKELFVGLMKKSINLSKLVDSTLITGIVTAAVAAKRAGTHFKIIKDVPNVIFVPSVTVLSLVSVKLTRWIFLANAGTADIPEEANQEEELPSEEQTLQGKDKILKNVTRKDVPSLQHYSQRQQVEGGVYQNIKDQTQEKLGRQGSLRRPSRKTISRSTSACSSPSLIINSKSKPSSEQSQMAVVDEMLCLFAKFETELTPSTQEIQAALQNVIDALKTGPCILQDPEQVKKLKRALHLVSNYRSEDSLAAGQMAVITNFEQEIDKLEAKFRNAADIATRASHLQANKEQAEKDFQEAYRLLKELKAKDDQFKDQIEKLKSEMESLKTAEKENSRKINDCFECGKFHKDLAAKCEMELRSLGQANEKAKKDKADVEAAFKNYKRQLS